MAKVAEMLPALSGTTLARWVPSVPFQRRTTGSDADTLAEFTLNEEPVTVTESPALPAVLDRFRVARLVQAKAAAPAMTDAAAAAPNTVVTFLRRFIAGCPPFLLVGGAGPRLMCCIQPDRRQRCNRFPLSVPNSSVGAQLVYSIHIAAALRFCKLAL